MSELTRFAELVRDPDFTLYAGDVLEVLHELPPGAADCVVTSPPYLDAREDVEGFTDWSGLFHALKRVVAGPVVVNVGRRFAEGVEWLWWTKVIEGAAYAGLPLLDTLIWAKPNANPIHGRVFADSHEYVLIFGSRELELNIDGVRRPHAESTKARFGRGWTNHRGVKEPRASRARKTRAEPNPLGALPRSYIEVCVGAEKGNPHPSPMAPELAEHLVSLASFPGETVLDPFAGSGNTARAARKLGRSSIAIEKSEKWARLCAERLAQQPLFAEVASA